jgi:viologen exporter family transport system permease protein
VPAPALPAPAAVALARSGFSRWAAYRQAALAGMFTNTVFGVIKLSVLLAIIDQTGGTVAGYDSDSLSTYVWVSQGLIAVVFLFTWNELSLRVRTGDISVDLTRPVDLQLSWLATDLGRATYSMGARALVPMVVGAALFGFHVPTDPTAVVLLVPSVVLAVVISFGCRFLVNLASFWVVEVRGLITFYVLAMNLLCGLVIPVQLFPTWMKVAAYATPFPWLLQAPCDLATGQAEGWRAAGTVAVQLAWSVVLLAAGRVVLARGTRKLEVQGG